MLRAKGYLMMLKLNVKKLVLSLLKMSITLMIMRS